MSPAFFVQVDKLSEARRSWQEYSAGAGQSPLTVVLGVILAAILVTIVVYAIYSSRDRMVGRRMFLRLARSNGLSSDETSMFMSVARRASPEDPCALFVRRSLFEGLVADMAYEPRLVDAVRRKVYGP